MTKKLQPFDKTCVWPRLAGGGCPRDPVNMRESV